MIDMVLRRLKLANFRNFSQKEFALTPRVTLIYGKNASGKSNLLEAVYLLATGGSLRAAKAAELVKEGETFARIEGQLTLRGEEKQKLEVILEKKENFAGGHFLKAFRVNGVSRLRRDFLGRLTAVLFSPEQLNLINNGPAYRRNYLDLTLAQADKDYFKAISTYNKAKINRNKLLYQISNKTADITELSYWDNVLVENSLVVVKQRAQYLAYVNKELINNQEGLWREGWSLQLAYQQSPLSLARLAAWQTREIAAGKTLIGPHREDILFFKAQMNTDERRDLHRYGSRGEQRLAVFALKLAEWQFLAQKGEKPLLLLDDIFSELDESHRQLVLQMLAPEQTLVTTAEAEVAERLVPKDWPVVNLSL
jgi:DNA replication and repair protein RecF